MSLEVFGHSVPAARQWFPMTDANQPTDSERIAKTSAETGSRKLAAIMFTDIKDFSKRMHENELTTLRMLEVHNWMMRESVTKYRGAVIKTIGDAFLVSFDSVVDAVSCAIEVQQRFHGYNKDKPSAERVTTRIGIHLGDIIVKDKDVFGDGVNIASRIQSMAEPGGVNISESVYQQVKNKLDIHVVRLGVPQLKNIKEAVKVYQIVIVPADRVRGKLATNIYVAKTILKRKKSKQLVFGAGVLAAAVVSLLTILSPGPALNSIAVLPFENLGPPEQEYLADGLSEEIIAQLSRLPNVLVIAKSSSFNFKGSKIDDQTIAKQLGVEYLLKGNVRSVAGQVSVVAYLVDATKAEKVWTESYLLSPNELFELQYKIPRQLVRRFDLQLTGRFETTSTDVYDLFSKGLFEAGKMLRENNFAAIGYLTEALERDSSFVPARIVLAKAYFFNHYYGWGGGEENITSAERQSQAVLCSDSTNAEALGILARIRIEQGQREEGVRLLNRAIAYDPKNLWVLSALGHEYLSNLNDPARGISYLQRALEIEPTNFLLASNIGIGYALLKNYPAAIEAFRRALLLNPKHDYPLSNLAAAFEKTANFDSAFYYHRAALAMNLHRESNYLRLGELLLAVGRAASAESVFTSGVATIGESYQLLYDLGVSVSRRGGDGRARGIWRKALAYTLRLIGNEPSSAMHQIYAGLLSARLAKRSAALGYVRDAIQTDSTDNEVLIGAARVYAVLGMKNELVSAFRKARAMNAEYDASYLTTALDFEEYRRDPELVQSLP
jgi:adenylate cyclase